MTTTIRLQREAFDVAAETAALTRGRTDIGAVVAFSGLCRADENGEPIAALTLEHYPGMAEAEIARHVEEARRAGVPRRHRDPSLGRIARARYRAGGDRLEPSRSRLRGRLVPDGLLKTRAPFRKQVEKLSGKDLGRRQGRRRCRRRALVGAAVAARGGEINRARRRAADALLWNPERPAQASIAHTRDRPMSCAVFCR